MPPTSKVARLEKLFEGSTSRPAPPTDANKPHIADLEMMSSKGKSKDQEKPPQVPVVAQYPRSVPRSPPRSSRDIDQMTSSEEDDYISAFKSKPSVKAVTPATRAMPIRSRQLGTGERGQHADTGGKTSATTITTSAATLTTLAAARPYAKPDGQNPSSTMDLDGNPVIGQFCPLSLVAKFPYKYLNDSNDRVSKHFFAQGKFYDQKWDIYCIQPPALLHAKPIALLPLRQVQKLLDDISKAFKIDINLPADPFVLDFFADGTPEPKFLGTALSRDEVTDMLASVSIVSEEYGEAPPNSTEAQDRSFATYKAKCERIMAANKKRSELFKKKKAEDRLLVHRDWFRQLKRAQRYFGLRPVALSLPIPDPTLSWGEQEQFRLQQQVVCGHVLEPLDVTKVATFPFEKQAVIISVDVESFERNHSLITEVGISTLDTLDLVKLPPGEGGCNWIEQIRSRHFRIRGREHLINKDFCIGNPENFCFGESEFVGVNEAADFVDSCFEYPFSAQLKRRGSSKAAAKTENEKGNTLVANAVVGSKTKDSDHSSAAHVQMGSHQRNILLLGHDTGTDLNYLKQLGSQIFGPSRTTYPVPAMETMLHGTGRSQVLRNIVEALDTAVLYKVMMKDSQSSSLAKVLLGLGIPGWHLHNAGNDARYTLEALVALALKARLEENSETEQTAGSASNGSSPPGGVELKKSAITPWDTELHRRIAERVASAEHEARAEAEMWTKAAAPTTTWQQGDDKNQGFLISSHDLSTVDGGLPGKSFSEVITEMESAKAKKKTRKEQPKLHGIDREEGPSTDDLTNLLAQ